MYNRKLGQDMTICNFDNLIGWVPIIVFQSTTSNPIQVNHGVPSARMTSSQPSVHFQIPQIHSWTIMASNNLVMLGYVLGPNGTVFLTAFLSSHQI